ncbi:MAG: response regulator [Chloroflexi bacterium]|nr:MAG: response regulator [Chloroflexota bacterium]
MSGLQNFLTPFSHLVFANRDKVILVLGLFLAWFTVWLLVTRWQNERLHRDLTSAKAAGSSSGGGRRYVTNAPVVEEAPIESGGALPPVKGGRTYARNLGTALQKAGMAPQIYSPPSPPGWAPNTTPTQPSAGQQPPYAPQNVPWAAPAPPQGSPWGGYPAGPGRGMPGSAPTPVPFYQPQPPPQQPMSQPIAPPPGVPGPFAPPVGSPFGPPAFPAMASGPAAPPSFAPPAPPGAPPAPPAPPTFAGNAAAAEPPAAEPSAGDAGRRGKPKRRRFNFNVLESLEKIVQSKTAEPAATTGWTPPVAGTPVTWTPPAPAPAAAAAAPAVPTVPQMSASAQPAPPVEATPAEEETPAETESLPLAFGPAEAKDEEPEAAAAETTVEVEEPVTAEAQAPVVEPEAQPEPEPEPEPKREARRSMRDMLFGEEAAAPEPKPAPAPVAAEPEPESQPEPEAEPVSAEHSWQQEAPTAEPVTSTTDSDSWRPWNAAPEPEPQPAVVDTVATEESPAADVPQTPAAGEGPSAGTVVIIEDDPVAANYYATLFRGNSYQVEVANDGVSGVDLCARVQPQVILLDVMMPRQNGILVLQTLRASDETKNTPVVVMSNFSEPTLIKRAIQLGALEYVIKTQVEGPALLNALPRWMNHEKAFAAA